MRLTCKRVYFLHGLTIAAQPIYLRLSKNYLMKNLYFSITGILFLFFTGMTGYGQSSDPAAWDKNCARNKRADYSKPDQANRDLA